MQKITRIGTSFLEVKRNSNVFEFPDLFTKTVQSYGQIYFWEKGNFHVVTKAEDAQFVLTSEDFSADRGSFFISRMPNLDLSLIQDFFSVVKKMMVMSDDEDHLKRRRAASLGFEDHILESYRDKVKGTIHDLVKSVEHKTHFDFVSSISQHLPSIVLADLFSIPQEDRHNFFRWSNIMTGFFGGGSQYRNEDGIEVNEAALALKGYFIKLVKERTAKLGLDYVSLVIRASKYLELTHDELISQLIMMLVAGQVTTTDQINNIMFMLAQRKDIQKKLKEQPEFIAGALEEFKRLDPAVTFIFRVARADTFIGTQPIKNGDVIFISTHAINRDLPHESAPDQFDLHRKGFNFAYGYGSHYCLGAKLARMEMKHLFEELLNVVPYFELDNAKDSVRDHYSLSFSGFKELHLKWIK